MKKISLILLSFLLLLGGCNPYPRDETLESYGYDLKDNGVYVLEVRDGNYVSTILDSNTEKEIGIGASIETETHDHIDLSYNYNTLNWNSKYNGDMDLDVKNVYSYIEEEIPMMATELLKLAEYKNVPMDELYGGDKNNIDKILYNNLRISNPVVVDSNTTKTKGLLENEYYLQVNYDLVNNTTESVNLGELHAWMCYSISRGSGKCNDLGTLKINEFYSGNDSLNPEDAISVQYTTAIPVEGYDFYMGINDESTRGVANVTDPINKE